MATDFYKKMIEPILSIQSSYLRKLAWELENAPRESNDNISRNVRMQTAEVLLRVSRVQDFADWILSDECGMELCVLLA